MGRVRDGAHARGQTLAVDVRYGLGADVQDQGVDQRDVVALSGLVRNLRDGIVFNMAA